VQNSLREGFGLTASEAMWKRAPVLANSRAVGLRTQIRDGIDGRLVRDPENPEELAAAIDELMAAPRVREELGKAGQRRVYDDFLVFAQVRRWLRLLETLAR
jgi:trehalose synthase